MQEITHEQLMNRIAALPIELQEAIYAPETFDTLELIAKDKGLDEVHIGLLSRIIVKLMAGFIEPKDFVLEIEDQLGLDMVDARFIAQEINSTIFEDVKDSLKKIHSVEQNSNSVGDTTNKMNVPSPYVTTAPISVSQKSNTILSGSPSQVSPVLPPPPLPPPVKPVVTAFSLPQAQVEQIRDITPPTPRPPSPTPGVVIPRPTPATLEPGTPRLMNNLESKLGGAFKIKNEIMFTQTGAPSMPKPVVPQPMPTPSVMTAPIASERIVPTPLPANIPFPPVVQTQRVAQVQAPQPLPIPQITPTVPVPRPQIAQQTTSPVIPPPASGSDPYRELPV